MSGSMPHSARVFPWLHMITTRPQKQSQKRTQEESEVADTESRKTTSTKGTDWVKDSMRRHRIY